MDLHSDKEAFKEIIALAAEHFGYEQSHVEKDYWVSKILRDISLSEYADKTYFKGGTSLSKAYGLIVENPLKVVPLIHSNLTPVKFSHSPFCLFLFSSYSSCPLCRVLH